MHTKKLSNKDSPLISVIITTYNSGQYLVEALESALAQQYVKCEIIIIDDFSKDNTVSILAGYAGNDKVRIIRHSKNRGPAASRNSGIKASRGEFLAFLDADDIWLEGHLARLLKVEADNGGEAIIVGNAIITDQYLKPTLVQSDIMPFPDNTTTVFIHLLRRNCINMCAILMPSGIAKKYPFNTRLTSAEDYDFWLRLASKDIPFVFLQDDPKVLYRQHGKGLSKKRLQSVKMTEGVLEEYASLATTSIAKSNLIQHRQSLQLQKIGIGQKRAGVIEIFKTIENDRKLYKREKMLKLIAYTFGGKAAKFAYGVLI